MNDMQMRSSVYKTVRQRPFPWLPVILGVTVGVGAVVVAIGTWWAAKI